MNDRTHLLIAATLEDAKDAQWRCPQLRTRLIVTPRSVSRIYGHLIGEYTWTPLASSLPARTRMFIRIGLAPCIDEDSAEEPFPAVRID